MVVDQVQRTVTEYARRRIDMRADGILMSAMPGVSHGCGRAPPAAAMASARAQVTLTAGCGSGRTWPLA